MNINSTKLNIEKSLNYHDVNIETDYKMYKWVTILVYIRLFGMGKRREERGLRGGENAVLDTTTPRPPGRSFLARFVASFLQWRITPVLSLLSSFFREKNNYFYF